jgi:hypothetical protein
VLTDAALEARQTHHAGEKLFVDYSGKKQSYIDPATGEKIFVELFVAVLGASNFTYAEATRTQQGPDWMASHQRAFAFFGGTSAAVRMALDGRRLVAIDLAEVELVSRDAVKLLAQAEAERIELRSCPAYIREWVTNERESSQRVVADGTGCWRKLLRRSL